MVNIAYAPPVTSKLPMPRCITAEGPVHMIIEAENELQVGTLTWPRKLYALFFSFSFLSSRACVGSMCLRRVGNACRGKISNLW